MAFIIDVTAAAKSDIRRKMHWLATNISRTSARNWRNKIDRAFGELSRDARSCPFAYESADLGMELREKLCGNRTHVYRILFTIEGSKVIIHHIRHAAQDWLTADDF